MPSLVASVAGRRVPMWDEHHVVIVLVVGELLAPRCRSFFDEPPTLFTCEVAALNDVGRYLRDISRIFPEVGLYDRDAPAHSFEKRNILSVEFLVSLVVAGVICEVVGREVRKLVDQDVAIGCPAAIGLYTIDVRFDLGDGQDAAALFGVEGGVNEGPNIAIGPPAVFATG